MEVVAKPKPKETRHTDLGVGIGFTRSVVFLSRNIKEFNDAPGYCVNLTYGGHKLMRFTAEFSQFNSINIEPTWFDVKARTYELNMHLLARFKKSPALIYPIIGLSLNEFSGFFTGVDDFQNLRNKYRVNSHVKSYWLGANFGLGYERSVGPVELVIAYKMRIGAADANERLNIMDVCYNIGIKYNFKALTPKYVYKSIFRKYRSRYPLSIY